MARRTTFKFNEDDASYSAFTERQPLVGRKRDRPGQQPRQGWSQQSSQADEEHEWALMETLGQLRKAACEEFDASNPEHMQTLESLWEHAFPGEPFERSSKRWGTLGFQGLDPTTDLRGAGYLGLRHLHNFVASFQVLPLSCPSDFPLAIASINCTAILVSYFGLNAKVVVPVPDAIRRSCKPSNDVQRAFLELSSKVPQATEYQLQQLHVHLLHALARQWARMHTPTTTIMDFPSCLQTTYHHFHLSVASAAKPWMLHDLVQNLQQPPWLAGRSVDPNSACLSATPMISFLLMVVAQLGCCSRSALGNEDTFDDVCTTRNGAPSQTHAYVPPLVAAL